MVLAVTLRSIGAARQRRAGRSRWMALECVPIQDLPGPKSAHRVCWPD